MTEFIEKFDMIDKILKKILLEDPKS